MTDKKLSEVQINQTLNMLKNEPLKEDTITKSKDNVWHKNSQKFSNKIMPEVPVKSLIKKFLTFRVFAISGVAFSVIIISIATMLHFGRNGNKTSSSTLTVKSSSSSSQLSSASVVETPITRPSDSDDFRVLAAQRIQQIMGISYNDIKGLEQSNSGQKNTPSTQNNSKNSIPNESIPDKSFAKIDNTKAAQLFKNMESSQQQVFYSEVELTKAKDSTDQSFYAFTGVVDVVTPVNIKTWYNANYNKMVVSQKGSVKYVSMFTPDYSLYYMGGDYAVKSIYDKKSYLGGIGYDLGNKSENMEVTFLKYLLDNSTAKDLGTKKIDGKDLKVLEIKYPDYGDSKSNMSPTSSKYYIDMSTFTIALAEDYIGNKVVTTTKNVGGKEYKVSDIESFLSPKELGNKEVKEVKDTRFSYGVDKVSEFGKKYPIYYVSDISNEFYAMDYGLESTARDYYKLIETKAFDPNFKAEYTSSSNNPNYYSPTASYMNKNLRGEIHTKKPSENVDQNYQIKNKKSVITVVDKNETEATYFELTSKDCYGNGCLISSNVEFKNGNNWYQISINPEPTDIDFSKSILNKPKVELKSLTTDEAKKIDQYNQEKQDSYPTLKNTLLKDIDPSVRVLPGNLEKKFKMSLSSVSKPTRSGDQSKCINFIDNYIVDCFIEKYNGFKLNYNYLTPNDNNYVSYVYEISVLNTSVNNIDLKNIAEKYNQNKYIKDENTEVLNYKNTDTKLLKTTSVNYTNEIYFVPVGNVTFIVNKPQDMKNIDELINTLKSSSQDKDLADIQAQEKKNAYMPMSPFGL